MESHECVLMMAACLLVIESSEGVLLHLLHRKHRWVGPGELGGIPVHILSNNSTRDEGDHKHADSHKKPFVVMILLLLHSFTPWTRRRVLEVISVFVLLFLLSRRQFHAVMGDGRARSRNNGNVFRGA